MLINLPGSLTNFLLPPVIGVQGYGTHNFFFELLNAQVSLSVLPKTGNRLEMGFCDKFFCDESRFTYSSILTIFDVMKISQTCCSCTFDGTLPVHCRNCGAAISPVPINKPKANCTSINVKRRS